MAAAVKALARPFVAVGDRVLISKAASSTAKRGSSNAPEYAVRSRKLPVKLETEVLYTAWS